MALLLAPPVVDAHAFSFKTPTGTSVSDFVHFYQCGVMSLSEQREKIYDPAVQLEFTNRLIAPDRIDNVFYIQYVPFTFPMMIPLALMPIQQSYLLWYGLSLAAGIGAQYALMRVVGKFGKMEKFILIAAVFASAPSIIALSIGQTSWFLLAYLSILFIALRNSKETLGGLALAMVAIKPQYMPLWLVSLFSLRRWRLLIVGGITTVLLLGLSAPVIGWQNITNYPSILFHAETTKSYSGVNPEGMISLRGALSQFIPQGTALPMSVAIVLLATVLTYILWQKVRTASLPKEWAMALTTVLSLVVSPHSHVYDLLLMSIPAILTIPKLSFVKAAALKSISHRIWCLTLMVYPFASWFFYCLKMSWLFLLFNLVLLISGLVYAFSDEMKNALSEVAEK